MSIQVKIPERITIHETILVFFIVLFILKLRDVNHARQLLELIVNAQHDYIKESRSTNTTNSASKVIAVLS